jgi:glycosyltransferase involved in cell wall biosynthesis
MLSDYSVLISVYDRERPIYLKLALDSVLNQTYPPSEVILVKDGPLTIELEDILLSYNIPSLRIIPLPNNKGLSHALNIGLKYCTHEFVARMDTDDICYPDRFEKQVCFLQSHPEIDIVGTFATKINECGNNLGELLKVPILHEDIIRLIWTCPMNHPTVMFRKDKILSVHGYNPDVGPRQDDYDLWFRCAESGLHFANISEPLLYYRFFAESVKKNSIRVGWYRMKVGLRGCWRLHLSLIAYIGVCIPFVRSLLPYPLNVYFQNLMSRINPRNIKG